MGADLRARLGAKRRIGQAGIQAKPGSQTHERRRRECGEQNHCQTAGEANEYGAHWAWTPVSAR